MPFHYSFFFFFNDTATTEIYTLSLHDALPIFDRGQHRGVVVDQVGDRVRLRVRGGDDRGHARPIDVIAARHIVRAEVRGDRKSTRLNSSHSQISYAVFCLKKKNSITDIQLTPS